MPPAGRKDSLQKTKRAPQNDKPYRRAVAHAATSAASKWSAEPDLDAMLLGLACALVESAPDRSIAISELGDQIALKIKAKGVHAKRDGKIVRLSAYMRGVHDGWETFLEARLPHTLRVDVKQSRLCERQSPAQAPMVTVDADAGRSNRRGAPPIDVGELDLSRL
jgi:hypothetical protein